MDGTGMSVGCIMMNLGENNMTLVFIWFLMEGTRFGHNWCVHISMSRWVLKRDISLLKSKAFERMLNVCLEFWRSGGRF
jgi:hypothetical protein